MYLPPHKSMDLIYSRQFKNYCGKSIYEAYYEVYLPYTFVAEFSQPMP